MLRLSAQPTRIGVTRPEASRERLGGLGWWEVAFGEGRFGSGSRCDSGGDVLEVAWVPAGVTTLQAHRYFRKTSHHQIQNLSITILRHIRRVLRHNSTHCYKPIPVADALILIAPDFHVCNEVSGWSLVRNTIQPDDYHAARPETAVCLYAFWRSTEINTTAILFGFPVGFCPVRIL